MTPTLDAFGMIVADMAASLAFYRRLGLDIPAAADHEPHAEVVLPGGLRLMWDTVELVDSIDPGYVHPTGHGRISLAFRCADPAEVDATYEMMTAAGYQGPLKPWDAFWGQRYATLHDPDGNGVDLYAALPGAPTQG
ncbi:VOC family protein [Plantactinospora sp. B5E13]|uniref:VOC family protein n=1 Tax=unclassified Plantactinospora TaxID=2631981 RepID=UPI00325D67E3